MERSCLVSIVCLLSLSLACDVSEEIFSEGVSLRGGLIPRMRTRLCFDRFIELLNSLSDESRAMSNVCVYNAAVRKSQLFQGVRPSVASAVGKIQSSLHRCTSNQDHVGYFQCLTEIVDEDKKLLDKIATIAGNFLKNYDAAMQSIDEEKKLCLEEAVRAAKQKSDQAYADLRKCMQNGRWPLTTTVVPTTEAPSTKAPSTEAPSTEAPSTEAEGNSPLQP